MPLVGGVIFRTLNRKKLLSYVPIVIQKASYGKQHGDTDGGRIPRWGLKVVAAAVISYIAGSQIKDVDLRAIILDSITVRNAERTNVDTGEADIKKNLPTYKADDVVKHDTKDDCWVTYRRGVYDITQFIKEHPGGEQILEAAGHGIEPFWNVYRMHCTPAIFQLLEKYRIGNLDDADVPSLLDDELWLNEPERDPRLNVKTQQPFNAETPPHDLVRHFNTPNELFFVRQHMPVPELGAEHKIRVRVTGACDVTRDLSLADLQRFPRAQVRATLMCAGNRRSEMDKQVKPVKGISWTTGAISHANWCGVYLRDVLLYCGVDPNNTEGQHVVFTGADLDATGTQFSTSIPLHMALDPGRHVLLATTMNGHTLPPDHGYPVRVIVPGAPAVRSCKWLQSITVSTEESTSHFHQHDYRSFNPSVTWETADFPNAPPIYNLPVTSAACVPADGDIVVVKDGVVNVRGYAYSGGGAKIVRVDVSADCGRSWVQAQQLRTDAAPAGHNHAWAIWQAQLPAPPPPTDQMEIWVKATDSNFNTQPENFDGIWNIRGLLSNAYHKITIKLLHC